MRKAVALIVAGLLLSGAAGAVEERVLQWGGDEAVDFDYLDEDAHVVLFDSPAEWEEAFLTEVQLYCRRFGEVGDIYGTVVILGPPEGRTEMWGPGDERLTILDRQLFRLAEVPAEAGWYSIPLDPTKIDGEFGVAVFSYSNEERGLLVGLSGPAGSGSHSGKYHPVKPKAPELGTTLLSTSADYVSIRGDGREWAVRAVIGVTVAPTVVIDPAQVSGPNFAIFDDGTAESFHGSQKHGPVVRIENETSRVVDRVYVFAHLAGAWFEADEYASVYLLDEDLRILQRKQLPYRDYATEPAWGYVEFDSIIVTPLFHVLVEPVGRPAVEMLIGCDTSGENQGSLWGTPGSILPWGAEAPEAHANWMIRVLYE
jgi:hypothetical protein